jgi:tetratricopeptide (TPR) repeat protein
MKPPTFIAFIFTLIGMFVIYLSAPAEHQARPDPAGPGQSTAMDEEVDDEILSLIKRGDELLRAKRYDEAITQYKAAIARADRPVFTAHLNLGSVYYEKGDFRAAVEAFRKATEIRPNDYRGHYNLAEALYASEDYKGSEAEYRKVIALNAKGITGAQAHHFLGLSLYKQGRIDEAVAQYRSAIDLFGGKYAEAHYNLGTALLERKDYPGAEREFRATIEQDKTFAEAHFNLGVTLEHQRRFREAAEQFEMYLSLTPDYSDAVRLRARIAKLKQQK